MFPETIEEVYEKNRGYRTRLLQIVTTISPEEEEMRLDGKGWNPREIIEHLNLVETGMAQIIRRLLNKGEVREHDGKLSISPEFEIALLKVANKKVPAPMIVEPTDVEPLAESLKKINAAHESLEAMHDDFFRIDGTQRTFPHPVFGALTAHDWILLLGLHESRHINQIENILNQNR